MPSEQSRNGLGPFMGICLASLLLAGCQTVKEVAQQVKPADPFVGSGELGITPGVHTALKGFLKMRSAAYFAVSVDGARSGWSRCDAGPDQCQGDVSPKFQAIKFCEKQAKKTCRIFARGKVIVWDGPVLYGTMPKSDKLLLPLKGRNPAFSKLSKKEICANAIDYSTKPYEWLISDSAKFYVAEAKSRNYFLYECAFEVSR